MANIDKKDFRQYWIADDGYICKEFGDPRGII